MHESMGFASVSGMSAVYVQSCIMFSLEGYGMVWYGVAWYVSIVTSSDQGFYFLFLWRIGYQKPLERGFCSQLAEILPL